MDKVFCLCGNKYESEFAKEDWATCPKCDMPIKYVDGIRKMCDENTALRAEVEEKHRLNMEYANELLNLQDNTKGEIKMFGKIMIGWGISILLICGLFHWLKKRDKELEEIENEPR